VYEVSGSGRGKHRDGESINGPEYKSAVENHRVCLGVVRVSHKRRGEGMSYMDKRYRYSDRVSYRAPIPTQHIHRV